MPLAALNRRRLLQVLGGLLLLGVPSSSSSEDGPVTESTALLLFDIFMRDPSGAARAENLREFLQRLPAVEPQLQPSAESIRRVTAHPDELGAFLRDYLNKARVYLYAHARELRGTALHINLPLRGYSAASAGYEELQRQSQENAERFLSGKLRFDPRDPEMASIYRQIDRQTTLYFVHNTNHRLSQTHFPLLSSAHLNRLGFLGGLQSEGDFNRMFLRTDDFVFFIPIFAPPDDERARRYTSVFGSKSVVLRFDSEAVAHGFVSAYVMNPPDLWYMAAALKLGFFATAEGRRYVALFEKEANLQIEGEQLDASESAELERLVALRAARTASERELYRQSQYLTDFTPLHFLCVQRAIMKQFMWDHYREDPGAGLDALLRWNRDFEWEFQKFSRTIWGGTLGWEFKIPVFVASEQVSFSD